MNDSTKGSDEEWEVTFQPTYDGKKIPIVPKCPKCQTPADYEKAEIKSPEYGVAVVVCKNCKALLMVAKDGQVSEFEPIEEKFYHKAWFKWGVAIFIIILVILYNFM